MEVGNPYIGVYINKEKFIVPLSWIKGWNEIIEEYYNKFGKENVSVKEEFITILLNKTL